MEVKNLMGHYTLEQSIMIYKDHSGSYGGPKFYLESHRVKINDNGLPELQEGRPLQKQTVNALVKELSTNGSDQIRCKGVMPSNVLYFEQKNGTYRLIWHVPASLKRMYFVDSLGIPDGVVSMPSLIFDLSGKTLSVFATKIKSRPTVKTKLYRAPFHNVANNGIICLGNGRTTLKSSNLIEDIQKEWEKLFWNTEFSHHNGKPTKTNLNVLLKDLVNSDKPFPKEVLIPCTFKNLNELIDKNSI